MKLDHAWIAATEIEVEVVPQWQLTLADCSRCRRRLRAGDRVAGILGRVGYVQRDGYGLRRNASGAWRLVHLATVVWAREDGTFFLSSPLACDLELIEKPAA